MDEDEKEDEREDRVMTSVTVADSAAFLPPESELKVLRATRHKTMKKTCRCHNPDRRTAMNHVEISLMRIFATCTYFTALYFENCREKTEN